MLDLPDGCSLRTLELLWTDCLLLQADPLTSLHPHPSVLFPATPGP